MKLIIDTDPGIDDAMAFYYAHASDNFELLALTTIFGNVTVADATRNALRMVEDSGASAKVYAGASAPIAIPPNAPSSHVHGARGFGAFDIEEPSISAEPEHAVDFLVRAARANVGELTVCAVGPLTNIARAIERDPEFVSNLHQLVIMGGTLYADGNVSPYAEANFWNDPDAADIVVNAPGDGRILIVGLDVTRTINFTPQDFDDLAAQSPKTGSFLKEIGAFYMEFYAGRSGRLQCSLHDPAAVIACHRPDLFETEAAPLQVITGGEKIGQMVRQDKPSARVCHVCVRAKNDDILKEYKTITGSNP